MLAIFGFRKNRSQTSGQGSECSAEFYGDVGPVPATATMGFENTQKQRGQKEKTLVLQAPTTELKCGHLNSFI